MKIKVLSILLLGCVFFIFACSNVEQTDYSVNTDSISESLADTKLSDNLIKEDFNGETFQITTFTNNNFHYEIDLEEMTGDVLDDAIYSRNLAVEEIYNIDIVQKIHNDGDNYRLVTTNILANDDSYDLSIVRCGNDLDAWKNGYIYTYDKIPNIDLTQKYWDSTLNNSLTINNIPYTAVGAFNLDIYDLTFCLVFNKNMALDYDLGNMYDMVKNGSWTYDKLGELMSAVRNDLNGDGELTIDDRFGYTSAAKMTAPGFWIAAGVKAVEKDENDMPYLALDSEKFINVWDKIFEVVWDTDATYFGIAGEDVPADCITLFKSDQSLFMDISFFYIESLRDTEVDFGIIPYPKYSEEQENTYCRVCYYMPCIVPITNSNLEMTGRILEALHCLSYEKVIPAYYDISLKSKYSRDNESVEMLDLIFQSRVIDIGDSTLCGQIRDNFIAGMMTNNKRNLASAAKVYSKSIMKYLYNSIPEV